jgi:8-oxo-dGTP diphosphatase
MGEFDTFFRSAFSVDKVIFSFDGAALKVLLIKRTSPPYKGKLALPGDLVYPNEDLDLAAKRIVEQLTTRKNIISEQVQTFGMANRHPLGRVISIAYLSVVRAEEFEFSPASILQSAQWCNVNEVGELAFDHNIMLLACMKKLVEKASFSPILYDFLPSAFTLSELQVLQETIFQQPFEKRNFRKKLLSLGYLEDLETMQTGVAHRPAKLYRLNREKWVVG